MRGRSGPRKLPALARLREASVVRLEVQPKASHSVCGVFASNDQMIQSLRPRVFTRSMSARARPRCAWVLRALIVRRSETVCAVLLLYLWPIGTRAC